MQRDLSVFAARKVGIGAGIEQLRHDFGAVSPSRDLQCRPEPSDRIYIRAAFHQQRDDFRMSTVGGEVERFAGVFTVRIRAGVEPASAASERGSA